MASGKCCGVARRATDIMLVESVSLWQVMEMLVKNCFSKELVPFVTVVEIDPICASASMEVLKLKNGYSNWKC